MNLDWTILYFIQDHLTTPIGDWLMPKVTHLGDLGIIWIVLALGLIISKKYKAHGVVMLIALVIGVLIGNVFLKNLIERPRPIWLDSSVTMLIPIPDDYSFPSGHTLASVIGATCLFLTNKKFGWWAIPLASLIAFSRLYLFVHFPSDVFASIILGIIIGSLSIKYLYAIVNNQLIKLNTKLKKN